MTLGLEGDGPGEGASRPGPAEEAGEARGRSARTDRPDRPAIDSIADGVDLPTGSYEWTRFAVGVRSAEKRRVRGFVLWESGDYYNGDLSTVEAGLAVRPLDVLTLEVTGERSTGTVSGLVEVAPDVDALTSTRIEEELVGLRMEINISPDLQISSFSQYETQSREFGSNNRLRWSFSPQGDLFLVYNHAMERIRNRWRFVSNQTPLKIQYTWRF